VGIEEDVITGLVEVAAGIWRIEYWDGKKSIYAWKWWRKGNQEAAA
jgi:hypothetical protein